MLFFAPINFYTCVLMVFLPQDFFLALNQYLLLPTVASLSRMHFSSLGQRLACSSSTVARKRYLSDLKWWVNHCFCACDYESLSWGRNIFKGAAFYTEHTCHILPEKNTQFMRKKQFVDRGPWGKCQLRVNDISSLSHLPPDRHTDSCLGQCLGCWQPYLSTKQGELGIG